MFINYPFRLLQCLVFLVVPFLSVAQNIDTIDFEQAHQLIEIDTAQSNIWHRAIPQKNVFDSAYSGSKAIITDSVNPYPASNLSRFTLGFTLYGGQPIIEFKHRFDTDSLHDGGFVEISNDSGNTWMLVSDTTYMDWNNSFYWAYGLETQNLYGIGDSLANGSLGFSGDSKDWISSTIMFPCYAIKKPFELMLRFSFYSDSTAETRDGWMIDQIIIDNSGDCSSIDEHNLAQLQVYPNPATDEIRIKIPDHQHLKEAHCELYDFNGRMIWAQEVLQATNPRLNIQNLKPGIYSLLLYDSNTAIGYGKVIIRK